jgi:hypothetical protein
MSHPEIKTETINLIVSVFDSKPLLMGIELVNLYEIAAGVIQDSRGGHSHICRLHRKFHTKMPHLFILLLDIADLERCKQYSVLHKSFFERFHRRVTGVWLQQQLCALWFFG